MGKHRADMLVHIDEALATGELQELERTLGAESGVYSACVSDKTTHLMVVEYDPEDISAKYILDRVQEAGVHAEIVAL
jgi:hypothetical protein